MAASSTTALLYRTLSSPTWDCRPVSTPLATLASLPILQPCPISANVPIQVSMCVARAKVGANVFRCIHAAVLRHAGPDCSTLWKGLRDFAVDGFKLNLPRELVREGYAAPSPEAHYPQ